MKRRIKVIKRETRESVETKKIDTTAPVIDETAPKERGIKAAVDKWINEVRDRRERQNLIDQQMFFGGVSS